MSRIEFKNDFTRAIEEMEGSDGRANTSSRADGRAYYNSRDEEHCFTVAYDFQDAASGEYGAYWQNTDPNRTLVISSIGINSAEASRIKLWAVSGTAAGGTVLVPTNMNRSSSKAAISVAMEGASAGTGITGLTGEALIDCAYVTATGHEEFRLRDTLRLGQNDAIAIQYAEGTTGDFSGVIFAYYE